MYKFDEARHIHSFDDKPLCGVTTVLGIIAKPTLIQWSADLAAANAMEVDKIDGFLAEYEAVQQIANYDEKKKAKLELDKKYPQFKQCRVAHRQKKEKAGDWGKEVHKAIEEFIKDGKQPNMKQENQMKVFDKFIKWTVENKVECLESEKHLWSKELWIGGIMDLIVTIDGKKYIGDIKTSSGIWNEAFFQMGAYHLCLEEMGEAEGIEGYVVINLKKDGEIDFKMAQNMDINKEAFKSALSLYKITKSLK